MLPVEKYGVKLFSIGFFVDPDQAIVWRGPMASKALRQLFSDAEWGELDYMLIDLPPGTSDIHLLLFLVPVTGAIIVSTPQNVALADARKGIAMFKMNLLKFLCSDWSKTWLTSPLRNCPIINIIFSEKTEQKILPTN